MRGCIMIPFEVKTMKRNVFQWRTTCLITSLLLLSFWLYGGQWAYSAEYFVDQGHPKAKDVNPGSSELPLKTITAAAAKAKVGDTVLIATGTYREMILLLQSGASPQSSITFRALPGADVIIKGSDPVSGWVRHNSNIWKKTGWEINSQQVFVDELPLQQLGETCPLNVQFFENKPLLPPVGEGVKDIQPGTFYYSESDKTLFIRLMDDGDPNVHLVEAAVRDFIIPPLKLDYITLEGLHFAHSNLTSKGLIMGMVNVWGHFWTIADCTFNYGDFAGISIIGEGHKITNCKFNHNGNLGISINGSDETHKWAPVANRPSQNILLSGNETSYNNYRKFELSWQHGGIKAAVSCNGITVTQHKALANYGAGIWFDLHCRNINISRSTVSNNLVGIGYEISDQAVIANNLVSGNEYQGIYVSASNDVEVVNNTLDNNGFGIVVHGLPRAEHPTLNNNRIINNIISESRLVDLILYKNEATAKGNTSDYNLFSRDNDGVKISWTDTQSYNVTHTTLSAFVKDTGYDVHSLKTLAKFKNSLSKDYRLTTESPAIDAGTNLITDIGNQDISGNQRVTDGRNTGIPIIDLGAYEYKHALPTPTSLKVIK